MIIETFKTKIIELSETLGQLLGNSVTEIAGGFRDHTYSFIAIYLTEYKVLRIGFELVDYRSPNPRILIGYWGYIQSRYNKSIKFEEYLLDDFIKDLAWIIINSPNKIQLFLDSFDLEQVKATFLRPRLKEIARYYESWFALYSGIQVFEIDLNECKFNIKIRDNYFSIRLIEKNDKILVVSDSFEDEINSKDLETFLHGYIYSTCVIFNQLKL